MCRNEDLWPPPAPYRYQFRLDVTRLHNPEHDPHALCTCGHPYAAHFASDEGMLAVGCRECEYQCKQFTPASPPPFPAGTPPVYLTLTFSRDGLGVTPGGPYPEPDQAHRAAQKALRAGAGAVQILEASADGVRLDVHLTAPQDTGEEPPYLTVVETTVRRKYNPRYGDDRLCRCGHTYYRHFDWGDPDEANAPVGCKYCPDCDTFTQAPEPKEQATNE